MAKNNKPKNDLGKKPTMNDVMQANGAKVSTPKPEAKVESAKVEPKKAEPIKAKVEPVVATPVETPVVETPVVETPVVETPVVETPVVETPVTPVVVETPEIIVVSKEEFENESQEKIVIDSTSVGDLSEVFKAEDAKDAKAAAIKDIKDSGENTNLLTTENEKIVIPEPAVEPVEPVVETVPVPSAIDLEELVVERWWLSQNKPMDVNHFELAYSSGINMDRFSNSEAIVGKFKFTRQYAGGNWVITIQE